MKFVKIFTIAAHLFFPSISFAQDLSVYCRNIAAYTPHILEKLRNKDEHAISNLPECFKLDRSLILKAVTIDPAQFENAADILKEDQNFVYRLLKISPQALQYASPDIRGNKEFMEKATYLSRDSLQYAAWRLLDNRLFMKRMIEIDSRNYKFASDRLKEIPEFATRAFSDNGLLLEFAPNSVKSNKKLVTIAVKSNASSLEFANDTLRQDRQLKKLAEIKTSITSPARLDEFLYKNYTTQSNKKNLGLIITNRAKNFSKNIIVQRNYVTKWHRSLDFNRLENGRAVEDLRLISASSRNYPNSWRKDFKDYPDLIKKIEKFFLNHNLDKSTIDNLSTTFLWKIKNKPSTLAFNLYLLRDSADADLGPEFAGITSLTAIVQKCCSNKWEMTVVQVIFDSETKVDVAYENGHKQYQLWDLYTTDSGDKNPKLIFKVEDRFNDYFEVFEEQKNGKYLMVQRTDLIKE